MSTTLFDLDDFEETRVEWTPIYKVYGDLASMIQPDLCRDCGAKSGYNQGGAGNPRGTSFMICDECARIDGCQVIEHDPVIERDEDSGMQRAAHCSCGWWIGPRVWGDNHEPHEYTLDELRDIVADHIRPRHRSHWGCAPHDIADCEKLHAAQQKRRENYLRRQR